MLSLIVLARSDLAALSARARFARTWSACLAASPLPTSSPFWFKGSSWAVWTSGTSSTTTAVEVPLVASGSTQRHFGVRQSSLHLTRILGVAQIFNLLYRRFAIGRAPRARARRFVTDG